MSDERRCVTGADPDEPYNVPWFSSEYREAPDLARIGEALIAACDEFEDLRWAMGRSEEDDDGDESAFAILYLWKKKASKTNDRVKLGQLAKAAGKVKHLSESEYIVEIAADASRGMTHWEMEAAVFHELYHIKIERKVLKQRVETEDIKVVPDLKVRAHDLEMFHAEVERYGLWRPDLRRGQTTFAQAPMFGEPTPMRRRAS